MSQSLYTAMGGISAATTELSVISNNVANINTTAFKSSSVQFSDVYSTTLSYGSVATTDSGGTNPVQIGVGVEVSAVSTDFSTGSWYSTGSDTDLMINGQGFFTVQATDGTTYYTRAGNFSIDENGNLVTSDGYKVLGTDTNLATKPSATTVKIPTSITASVDGTDLSSSATTKSVLSLNGTKSSITTGYFQVKVTDASNNVSTYNVRVNGDSTVKTMMDQINTDLAGSGVVATIGDDGTIAFNASPSTSTFQFVTPTSSTAIGGTTYNASNFLTQTSLGTVNPTTVTDVTATTGDISGIVGASGTLAAGALTLTDSTGTYSVDLNAGTTYSDLDALASDINTKLSTAGSDITASVSGNTIVFTSASSTGTVALGGAAAGSFGTITNGTASASEYTSGTLDYSVHITDLTSTSTSASSETINADGSLEVTYKDGSTLSVEMNDQGVYQFVYTSADSVKIDGANCTVDATVAEPANFVIQMATVTNTEGLLSVGSNLYAAGPNTGDIVYTIAGDMGCGKVASGGLEASNVDLSEELSNMILAQRAIQANSRVFTTTADIMDTITQMGR